MTRIFCTPKFMFVKIFRIIENIMTKKNGKRNILLFLGEKVLFLDQIIEIKF